MLTCGESCPDAQAELHRAGAGLSGPWVLARCQSESSATRGPPLQGLFPHRQGGAAGQVGAAQVAPGGGL